MSIPAVLQGRNIHDAAKPISWLVGRWKSDEGRGSYPSIPSFQYGEEIEFVALGQPLLNYSAFTWHPEKKVPLHLESGFLRINPGTNKLAFLVAHNFGLTILEEGEVIGNEIKLESTNISRMSFAKDPAVSQTQRVFHLNGDTLEQVVSMATTSQPMTEHLRVTYTRVQQ